MVYPVSFFLAFLGRLCKSDGNRMMSPQKLLTHTSLSLRSWALYKTEQNYELK